jgi:hypothetical protein
MTTSPELPRRAEQALLGALLTDRARPRAGELRAQDFGDPVHQAIYAALTGEVGTRGPLNWLRGWLTRLLNRDAREAAAYLEDLPGLCPQPSHAGSYQAMVAQARDERAAVAISRQPGPATATQPQDVSLQPRQAIAPAEQLAAAADYLAGPAAGRKQADAETAASDAVELAPDVARLARALRPAIRALRRQAGELADRDQAAAKGSRSPGWSWSVGDSLQDQVLATVMHPHGNGRSVVDWLPAEAFTPGPRRQLYELVRDHMKQGKPVDPLLMAWTASSQTASSGTAEPPTAPTGTAATLALRLGTWEPTSGAAPVLARALLAESACTTKWGADWSLAPRFTHRSALAALDALSQQSDATAGATAAAPSPEPALAGATAIQVTTVSSGPTQKRAEAPEPGVPTAARKPSAPRAERHADPAHAVPPAARGKSGRRTGAPTRPPPRPATQPQPFKPPEPPCPGPTPQM